MRHEPPADRAEVLERNAAHMDRLRASGHPAYGLDAGWRGARAVGDVEFENGVLAVVGLVHGDPTDAEGTVVEVFTTLDDAPRRGVLLGLRALGVRGLRPREVASIEALGRSSAPASVTVDGESHAADGVVRPDGRWMLRVSTPPLTLYLAGRGIGMDEATTRWGLERIDDLEPYVRGRELLLRTHLP